MYFFFIIKQFASNSNFLYHQTKLVHLSALPSFTLGEVKEMLLSADAELTVMENKLKEKLSKEQTDRIIGKLLRIRQGSAPVVGKVVLVL